jgi:hypothetical protein
MRPRHFVAAIFGLTTGWTSEACATMPLLTTMPDTRSSAACHDWAADQDSDTLYMWGQQENGKSSEIVARSRLTAYYLGSTIPDIAKFGSSVGFDRAYCRRHNQAAICLQQ